MVKTDEQGSSLVTLPALRALEPRLLNPIVKNLWKSDRYAVDGWHYLASHAEVSKLLTVFADSWRPESGFFRVGQVDLKPEAIKLGNNHIRMILLEGSQEILSNIRCTKLAGKHQTRAFGHLLVRHCFSSVLHGSRSLRVADWTARYVRESVIPDDIRRRATSPYANLSELRLELSRLVDQEEFSRREPRDLLDVAALVAPSEQEIPEIYQRLVLSTTGFLGAAVEWLCIDLAKQPQVELRSKGFVRESLRLSAPAWRLTRTAAREVLRPGGTIEKNDELILNVSAANRDPLVWPEPCAFDSSRWNDSSASKHDLSFGKGNRSCPAQKMSLRFLDALRAHIVARYSVSWRPDLMSRPLVGTFNSPARGRIAFLPLDEEGEKS